ncbi:FtsW/RodA/SpoVE family cell cycle protein [Kordia sp. YSTF-M3]|uniref:Probable peptidoglycan glycosyltransferase FtsW n=1 Tax=Kordia aestuariivivens TaxID=2759037 RepID=A0ABR7Q438_9FLAO|nr:FtsW/RodA/SpoVE family cell cycle protein [Kordia aestuariivivens]MBC8753329.1 FtsW/RodA/SpoVE family cell cycle protein [Kordia aestuariivivens]
MNTIFKNIKGDRALWAVVALLALFSFLPVYSASSNLAYMYGDGSTLKFLIKHASHLFLGFAIIYGVHKMPYHYFKGLSLIMLPIVLLFLVYTLAQGTTIGGANASRWMRIPFVGIRFQTSTLANVVLMIYVARYLSRIKDKVVTFKETILPLWVPVFLVVGLILPANFSTTAIIFSMVLMLCFLGGYPWKYLLMIIGSGIVGLILFIAIGRAIPGPIQVKIQTWENRVTNYWNDDKSNKEANYQSERAKIAIASGGIVGVGAGKSVMKNLLPQSSSDFIYAIIVEEYGLVGALSLLFLYLLLLFRLVIVAHKADTIFGKLLAVGVGLPIIFQALINMAVAVELFPVTGQTLPLISSGGTSIWMTCLAIGIVLSVSAKREEIVEQQEKEENPLAVLSEAL